MRKLGIFGALALVAALFVAQVPFGFPPGVFQSRGAIDAPAAAAYVGPGDVVSGAIAWGGLRAYSVAKAGNRFANVCNSTGGVDVGCADMVTSATTGAVVPATVSGIPCPGTNCTIRTLYDQTGNTNCSGTACDWTQATVANRPTFSISCGTVSICMTFPASVNAFLQTANTLTQAQPFTVVAVTTQTGASGGGTAIFNSVTGLLYSTGNNSFSASCGTTSGPLAVNNNTYAAIALSCNGASTVVYYNALNHAWSAGVTGFSGQSYLGQFGNLNEDEIGVWAAAFNSTQAAAMISNQRTFWGF